MKSANKYDPEDIESLMLHKQFNELYPEEKEFVLRHLESEEEYESMRRFLVEIKEIKSDEGLLQPDKGLKKDLLKAFNSDKKPRFIIWLNSLFAAPDRSFWGQRGVQLSFSFAVVAFAIVLFQIQAPHPIQLAENKVEENKIEENKVEENKVEENKVEENMVVENIEPKGEELKVPIVKNKEVAIAEDESIQEITAPSTDSERVENSADIEVAQAAPAPKAEDFNVFSSPTSTMSNLSMSDISLKEVTTTYQITTPPATMNMQTAEKAIDLLFTAK